VDVRPGYKQTDVGIIPDDWEVKRIRDLVSIPITDGPHLTPVFLRDGIPFLSVNNLVGNKLDLRSLRFISPEDHKEFSKKCRPRRGDILFGKAASVGQVAIIDTDLELNIWSPLALIRVGSGASARFIVFALQAGGVRRQIALLTNSSSQGNIGMSDIGRIEVPLPSVSEQAVIAEALSDVDALLDGLDRLIAKKRDVKQAAMQQLLTGRTRLPGFDDEWEAKTLDSLGTWRGGVTPSMQDPSYWDGGDIPWIASGDVKSSRLNDTTQHVTAWAVRQRAAVVVPARSIVLVTRSGILRRFLPVALTARSMAINQDIKALIPIKRASPDFLLYALDVWGDAILASCLKAGTTVESVEFPWLRAFSIPVPPYEEQLAIAGVLSDMDAELAALNARRDKTRDLKRATMQELLTGRIRLPIDEDLAA
jgi:type I restriction enzyme S subunit